MKILFYFLIALISFQRIPLSKELHRLLSQQMPRKIAAINQKSVPVVEVRVCTNLPLFTDKISRIKKITGPRLAIYDNKQKQIVSTQ